MQFLALLTDFVGRHAHWAPVIAFVIAFLESLPFIGLFVPGTSTLLGLGAVVALSGGSVFAVTLGAAVGAVLGTWISYEVGRRHGARIQAHPFLLRRPRILSACERLFRRHGAMSVAMARFLPTLRPMVPMVAGAFGLEPRRFHIVNLTSVILWAPAFIVPGALTGLAVAAGGSRAAIALGVVFVLAMLGLWVIAHRRRR